MDDKWFKQQQKRAGVTADDIARKMGRTRANVSNIYTGRQKMSLEWAQAFADVLKVPIEEVLKRAGTVSAPTAQRLSSGFAESDVAPFVGAGGKSASLDATARSLGGGRAGIDVWQVKSQLLALMGYMQDDFVLIDTHQAERVKAGDVVIAQRYNAQTGDAVTLLRRFEPPVLVAASMDPDDRRVHVVDGNNVLVRGKVVASWRA